MENSQQSQFDEINLADYVKVIFKRWKIIFLVFILAIASGFIFSIIQPKIYKVDTILELGQAGEGLIEPIDQLIEKINNQVFNGKYKVGIRSENFKNTSLINIISESADPEKSKNALEEVSQRILAEHQKKTEIQKQLIQNNIDKTGKKIEPLKNDIIRIQTKIKSIKSEKWNLSEKIKSLEQELIYNQTPGTQFALYNTKEKLESKTQEIETLYMQINSLNISLENLNIEINNLNKSLENIQETKIIKPADISPYPIKPKPMLNTAIAGVLGLFIGVFLAFVREWWKENMRQEL